MTPDEFNKVGQQVQLEIFEAYFEELNQLQRQPQTNTEFSDRVQQIYEDQGVAGAMDIINEFTPIVNRLVQRRSEAPNFDRQLLTDEINTGERGIFDLIQKI